MPPTEVDVAGRVACMQAEFLWRSRDQGFDLIRIQAHVAGQPINGRTGSHERLQRPVTKDLDTDLRQDPQGCAMDRLELVARQDLDRLEWVRQGPPREPSEPGRWTTRPAMVRLWRVGQARRLRRLRRSDQFERLHTRDATPSRGTTDGWSRPAHAGRPRA